MPRDRPDPFDTWLELAVVTIVRPLKAFVSELRQPRIALHERIPGGGLPANAVVDQAIVVRSVDIHPKRWWLVGGLDHTAKHN